MPSHATLFINAKNTLKKLQSSANIDREYLTLRKQPTTDPPPNSELPTETHPPESREETRFNSQKIRARSYTGQKTETKNFEP